MVETRIELRHRVLKAGTIEFGSNSIDCMVRNLSITGAALEVSNQIGIPARFTLVIPEDGLHLPCNVVRRSGYRIGVAFDQAASVDSASVDSSFMYFDHSTSAAQRDLVVRANQAAQCARLIAPMPDDAALMILRYCCAWQAPGRDHDDGTRHARMKETAN